MPYMSIQRRSLRFFLYSIFIYMQKFNMFSLAYLEPTQTYKMELFEKTVEALAVNYFRKKLHLTCLNRFSIHPWFQLLIHEKLLTKDSCNLISWQTCTAITIHKGGHSRFISLISICLKKIKMPQLYFKKYYWSKHPEVWLVESHTWACIFKKGASFSQFSIV